MPWQLLGSCATAASQVAPAAATATLTHRFHGKRAEAYALLAPIYGWFTEGFETADLQEARRLRDELT